MNHAATPSWIEKRQFHDKGSPPHVVVFRVNRSAMFLDDAFRDGQTQSRTFFRGFGGKERLKNPVQVSCRNALAVVGDCQTDGWFRRGNFWTINRNSTFAHV